MDVTGLAWEDLQASIDEHPKNSLFFVTATPTMPWSEINDYVLEETNSVSVMDSRGDVSARDVLDWEDWGQPHVWLYDAPVEVAGKPCALHCLQVSDFAFLCPNSLLAPGGELTRQIEASRDQDSMLSNKTLLRLATLVKAELLE